MSKPEISIRIDGPSGAGKSVLAQHFATYLRIQHGIEVTLYDDGQRQNLEGVHNPLPRLNAGVTITVEQK